MTERIAYEDTSKGLMDGLMKTDLYLKKSGLDLKLLELMKFRISQINGCAFCLDMHHKEAIAKGETDQRIHGLAAWRETPYYNEKERAVFSFAEGLTRLDDVESLDDAFDSISQYYSKAEIADLVLAITQINTWNRINKAFRTTPGKYKVGQY
jgi:AhpD family alkylhydroperoxidase